MKNHGFHKAVWKFLRFLLKPYIVWRFGYTYEKCELEGPVLVMGNHDSNWDPLFLGCAFPRQMYFVASEHIFRWGFLSKLLNTFLAPISSLAFVLSQICEQKGGAPAEEAPAEA